MALIVTLCHRHEHKKNRHDYLDRVCCASFTIALPFLLLFFLVFSKLHLNKFVFSIIISLCSQSLNVLCLFSFLLYCFYRLLILVIFISAILILLKLRRIKGII